MNYVGDYNPGQIVYIYFNTFDSNDPSASVTIGEFANTDVHIHKDDDLTQRGDEAGVAIDIDVDGITGSHFISIDTADNTVDDFYVAGHDYFVRIEGTTVDGAIINAVVGSFSLGNRAVAGWMNGSAIATLASQVSFTLSQGSADDDAYKNCTIVVTDQATTIQKCIGRISAYTGATKTVTLAADPGIFTMAAGDNVQIFAASALANADAYQGVLAVAGAIPAVAADGAGGLPVSDTGGLDLDTQLAATNEVTAARMAALTDWINGGRLDLLLDAIPTTPMRGTDGANQTTPPTVEAISDQVHDEAIEDHDTQGTSGWATALAVYAGSDGPGIYIDSGASNTNTVVGTDGTEINPVSTFAAARTVADALGLKIYYLEGNSDITLAATHLDWEFIGIGSVLDNVVNLGSQDVSRSLFRNLTLEGIQGGSGRITARDCALQDPGAGATTLHIFAERCGFVDEIEVDASNDNVFDQCFSLVAGTAAPVIIATGAAGTISVRHYSGGLEFKSLSASHNVTWEGIGQVIFNADCNVNANVSVRGTGSITDNTAGMSSLTETSLVNMTKINTEADAALSDYDPPTKAEMDTAHALLATPAQVNTQVDLAFTTQMADSASADGAIATREQALYMLLQFLTERAVSGTTVTVKKVDGSTSLMTFTLDDATDPTSLTRAT